MAHSWNSILLFVVTFIAFVWTFRLNDNLRKFFYLLLALFIYIYCGLGVGYANQDYSAYMIYYTFYVLILSLFLYIFYRKDTKIKIGIRINEFSQCHSTTIIILYYLMLIVPLAMSGNLIRLISPPTVSLTDYFVQLDFNENQVSNPLTSLVNFVSPFFLIALYKYIREPIKLLLLYFIPVYVGYCETAYIGRGAMAFHAIFVIIYLYYIFPKYRKKILIASCIGFPSVVIFFAAYVSIRLGQAVDMEDFSTSMDYLVQSETFYYKWFKDITGETNYILNYVIWFITLPLPGFLKPIDMNFNFNALFTSDTLGIALTDIDSISLPGLVNESIFIFGFGLFFIHAILLAYVLSLVYNSLIKNKQNFVALIYTMLIMAMQTPRGGTSGPFSGAIKLLFVYFIFTKLFPDKGLKKSKV